MARRQAELDAVVGQYRVDFVRDGFDERDEEGRSSDAIGFLDKLNEGELRRAVDGDEEVELSLGSLHFGDVDMEEADRSLNFFFAGLSPSMSTSRPIPCLCRQRCNDDRVRCGMVGCSA